MSTNINLRTYQSDAVSAGANALAEGNNALLVSPTGSGKSLIIAGLTAKAMAEPGAGRTLVLAPSLELVEQDRRALEMFAPNLKASTACAGVGKPDVTGDVVFATPQTLANKLDGIGRDDFSLIVVDEAHRISDDGSSQIRRILASQDNALLVGATATPFRLDSGRLDNGDLFDEIAYEAKFWPLVQQGFLAPLVAPETPVTALDTEGLRVERGDFVGLGRFHDADLTRKIAREIIEQVEAAGRQSALVFCCDIEHATAVLWQLQSSGQNARLLTGATPLDERREIVAQFRAGQLRFLVGVDAFSVGFDAPCCDTIALVRPTTSPVWHVQSVGRGTRIAPGKRDCLVLDFARNFDRVGPIDAPRVPTKEEREGDGLPPTKPCPSCRAIIAAAATACPSCGHEMPRASRSEARQAKLEATAPAAGQVTLVAAQGSGSGFPRYDVTKIDCQRHVSKAGNETVMLKFYTRERLGPWNNQAVWLNFGGSGLVRAKAHQMWRSLSKTPNRPPPSSTSEAIARAYAGELMTPGMIELRPSGNPDFPEVVPVFETARFG